MSSEPVDGMGQANVPSDSVPAESPAGDVLEFVFAESDCTANNDGHQPVATQDERQFRKATREEFRNRVEIVKDLIAKGWCKSHIKRDIRSKFGHLSAKAIEKYIRVARNELAKEAGVTREVAVGEVLAGLKDVIRDSTTASGTKVAAWREIGDLYGAYPAKKSMTLALNSNVGDEDVRRVLATMSDDERNILFLAASKMADDRNKQRPAASIAPPVQVREEPIDASQYYQQ